MPGDVCVLPPDFALSKVIHVGFFAKKRACLVLKLFLKPVILHIVANFYLSLLLLGARYIMVATQIFGPHYYYPAFERLNFCPINFGFKKSGILLFALKKGKLLATKNFDCSVGLSALYNLGKGWQYRT